VQTRQPPVPNAYNLIAILADSTIRQISFAPKIAINKSGPVDLTAGTTVAQRRVDTKAEGKSNSGQALRQKM
jgi:hypothetical protein